MSDDTLIHIVPALRPQVDGAGEYALNLALELRQSHGVQSRFLVCDPERDGPGRIEDFVVQRLRARNEACLWSLLASAKEPRPVVLLHYCAYGYDLPGYLCPSARHLSAFQRAQFIVQAVGARLVTILAGEPQFLVQTDLAAFHGPFYLDADAVHWVSLHDLKLWATSHKGTCRLLRLGNPPFLSKDWVIKRICTTALQISKPA